MVPTEQQEHKWLAQYLDALGLAWWHTPNGGARRRVDAAILRGMGVKAGVPDFVIVTRPPKRPAARGVAIELKRRVGGRASPEQTRWLETLAAEGWLVHLAHGWEDAAAWLAAECGWGTLTQGNRAGILGLETDHGGEQSDQVVPGGGRTARTGTRMAHGRGCHGACAD